MLKNKIIAVECCKYVHICESSSFVQFVKSMSVIINIVEKAIWSVSPCGRILIKTETLTFLWHWHQIVMNVCIYICILMYAWHWSDTMLDISIHTTYWINLGHPFIPSSLSWSLIENENPSRLQIRDYTVKNLGIRSSMKVHT